MAAHDNNTDIVEIYPAWAMAYFGVACVSVVTFYWAGEGWMATAALREWATQIGFLALLAWRVRSLSNKDQDDSGRLDRLSLATTTTLAHLVHWLYIAYQTSQVGALLVQPVGWLFTCLFYVLSCKGLGYLDKEMK